MFLLLTSLLLAFDADEATEPQLVEALEDVDPGTRRDALEELGKRGLLQHEAAIVDVALTDPDPQVRRAAMASLEEMGAKGTLDVCEHMLISDVDERNRTKCLAWLERKGPDTGSEAVTHAATKDPSAKVRRKAVIIIGKRGWLSGADALMSATEDADPGVALEAWRSIVRLGDLEQRARVHELLATSTDVELKRGLLKAIGENPLPQDYEPLVAALRELDRDVAILAARALGELGDERAAPVLRELAAAHTDKKVAAEFGEAATKLGG